MVKQEYIDLLVGIPGWSAKFVGTVEDWDGKDHLMIEIGRQREQYRCSCGREFTSYYDGDFRDVRDLPFGPHQRVSLVFWQVRIDCPDCGIVTERLDFIEPRVGYTKRLAAAVALSCRELRSLKSVASQYQIHRETVKDMDKAALERDLPHASETSPRLIGVDEFSIRKRHHYATTVVDLERKTVPYVADDRTTESLAGYYRALGPQKCAQIEAAAMDMWAAYEEATRSHCPNAEIVYDPFHIISAYGRDVVDQVRVEETRKAHGEAKDVLKGSRYLLLKNAGNLETKRSEPARLAQVLGLNKRLATVYVLKDDLKQLWLYRSESWARKWFDGWYRRAMHSRINALKKFSKKLKSHIDGLLAHCRYQIHTGILEGINNKIKVIKRVAFGFRDYNYFFLKIRGAFMTEKT
jgi:transposase